MMDTHDQDSRKGHVQFVPCPQCVICKEYTDMINTQVGYGSTYDTCSICWSCFGKYLDPAIDRAIAEHEAC
jgi:hypothetical protein